MAKKRKNALKKKEKSRRLAADEPGFLEGDDIKPMHAVQALAQAVYKKRQASAAVRRARVTVARMRLVPEVMLPFAGLVLLFQLCLLAYAGIVNFPEALSYRASSYTEGEGSIGEAWAHVVVQVLLLLLSMAVLQPVLLKNTALVTSLVGSHDERYHMLYRVHTDMEVTDSTLDAFCGVIEEKCEGSCAAMRDAVPLAWGQKVQLRFHRCCSGTVQKPMKLGQVMTDFQRCTPREFNEGGRVTKKRLKLMMAAQHIAFNISDFQSLWKFVNPRLNDRGITIKQMQARVEKRFTLRQSSQAIDTVMEMVKEKIFQSKNAKMGMWLAKKLSNTQAMTSFDRSPGRTGGKSFSNRVKLAKRSSEMTDKMQWRLDHSLHGRPWYRNAFDRYGGGGPSWVDSRLSDWTGNAGKESNRCTDLTVGWTKPGNEAAATVNWLSTLQVAKELSSEDCTAWKERVASRDALLTTAGGDEDGGSVGAESLPLHYVMIGVRSEPVVEMRGGEEPDAPMWKGGSRYSC